MGLKRRVGHWTPRYVWDRCLVKWYELRNPDSPWLTRDAIHILAEWLTSKDQGLEFGSGRSTVWFASRVAKLTSVEHDKNWHDRVIEKMRKAGLGNVQYLFREVEESIGAGEFNPYADVASQFPDASLDFVLIDGATRSACALVTLAKVRPGGLLIVDNANWSLPSDSRSPASRSRLDGPVSSEWQLFWDRVASWRCIWTSNGVTDTAIFIRSCTP